VTYRAELSGRALKQMHGLPAVAFDSLSDPYVRRLEFGHAGLITYLINDGASVVIILDITWAG
jgi:hypothetical protein